MKKNVLFTFTLCVLLSSNIYAITYDTLVKESVVSTSRDTICGDLEEYGGKDGYIKKLTLPVEMGTLVFDVQTNNVPDRVIAVINGDTVVDLTWGRNNLSTGDLVGPFLWENGVMTAFAPESDSIPFWSNVRTELKGNLYGLARFVLTIPPNVCQVCITVISNDDKYTIWKLFQHCCKDCAPILPTEYYRDTTFCVSGSIDSILFLQDATYDQHTTSVGGCKVITHWEVIVSALPTLEVTTEDGCLLSKPIAIQVMSDEIVRCTSVAGLVGNVHIGEKEITIPKSFLSAGENIFSFWTSNNFGCQSDTTISVSMFDCNIFFPNAFSPNGDGSNDYFFPFSGEGVVSEVISMIIYGEWGEFVWQNQHFPPNDPTQGWNGTFRDQPFHIDVLVYYALVKFFDGSIRSYKGDVTLLR